MSKKETFLWLNFLEQSDLAFGILVKNDNSLVYPFIFMAIVFASIKGVGVQVESRPPIIRV